MESLFVKARITMKLVKEGVTINGFCVRNE